MIKFLKALPSSIFLLIVHFSYAQDTLTYFNRDFERVYNKDSASFYGVGINDNGVYRDSVKLYWMTGELIEEGFCPKWGGMGEFTGYFKNGRKFYTGIWMDNEFTLINSWDSTGVKTMKRGTGLNIWYHPYSMKVWSQGNYKNNLKVGYWVWNNRSGKKIAEATYIENETMTAYNVWDDNGEKQLVINGNGTLLRYYTNGRLKLSEEWKDNKREGKCVAYYENGSIKYEQFYKNNKKEGIWKRYFSNRVCMEEISYTDGEMHGPVIIRVSSGMLYFKGQFKFGQRSGLWEWYNKAGYANESFNYN